MRWHPTRNGHNWRLLQVYCGTCSLCDPFNPDEYPMEKSKEREEDKDKEDSASWYVLRRILPAKQSLLFKHCCCCRVGEKPMRQLRREECVKMCEWRRRKHVFFPLFLAELLASAVVAHSVGWPSLLSHGKDRATMTSSFCDDDGKGGEHTASCPWARHISCPASLRLWRKKTVQVS